VAGPWPWATSTRYCLSATCAYIILYKRGKDGEQGSSYDDPCAFPNAPRRDAGFQLSKVQAGLDPDDWKSFDEVGSGTREIRIKDEMGIYRVMFVAKFEEAIYVLHCFQKKTQKTSKRDKKVAETRYKAVVRDRSSGDGKN
jgi:phage-related protein